MLLAEVSCFSRPLCVALKCWACTWMSRLTPDYERIAPQALMRHSIGRSWRRSLAGGYPDALLGLLRSFWDVPDPSSPFSVHNLCADGAAYGCVSVSFHSTVQLRKCLTACRLLLDLTQELLRSRC